MVTRQLTSRSCRHEFKLRHRHIRKRRPSGARFAAQHHLSIAEIKAFDLRKLRTGSGGPHEKVDRRRGDRNGACAVRGARSGAYRRRSIGCFVRRCCARARRRGSRRRGRLHRRAGHRKLLGNAQRQAASSQAVIGAAVYPPFVPPFRLRCARLVPPSRPPCRRGWSGDGGVTFAVGLSRR
jgi:hypothetical protein